MSSQGESLPASGAVPAEDLVPAELVAPRVWERFDGLLVRLSERLNPIVVKEARQALKSMQFTITFTLVLTASWLWSLAGLAFMGDSASYIGAGQEMFYGFYLILSVPLLVIVPFGAFRSLAAEREDRTFELVAITTLKARHVISGKLAAAVLQMLVYLSAVMPCIAFTYLLRGIDILTILAIVAYTCLASLAFSLIALLTATATNHRYRQMMLLVTLVGGLGLATLGAMTLAFEMLQSPLPFDEGEYWIFNLALMTAYTSYMVMFFQAATAQISFASSNRSTPLRITMLVQQALFTGWMAYGWFFDDYDPAFLVALAMLSAVHWYVMGVVMTGESSGLSPRVKRSLPQSFLGRAFFTWFNPGPGTGYLFALSNYLVVVLVVAGAYAGVSLANLPLQSWWLPARYPQTLYVAWFGLCYLAFYLGLGKLLLGFVQRVAVTPIAVRVVVHLLLLVMGSLGPFFIQMIFPEVFGRDYTLLQVTNVFWTAVEVVDKNMLPYDIDGMTLAISALGFIAFVLNLPGVIREVAEVRIAKPQRVALEDLELNPPTPEPTKTNPWD